MDNSLNRLPQKESPHQHASQPLFVANNYWFSLTSSLDCKTLILASSQKCNLLFGCHWRNFLSHYNLDHPLLHLPWLMKCEWANIGHCLRGVFHIKHLPHALLHCREEFQCFICGGLCQCMPQMTVERAESASPRCTHGTIWSQWVCGCYSSSSWLILTGTQLLPRCVIACTHI